MRWWIGIATEVLGRPGLLLWVAALAFLLGSCFGGMVQAAATAVVQ